ncbi:hypothetical protein [Photobacterium leiognathi]|uniref:hypothetical protein n=1 Tax=Photobacterium leiognathi TaxID=553611 RepID=UPI002980D87C|nr:hypothetical protein [Photobacterium leiognathi]
MKKLKKLALFVTCGLLSTSAMAVIPGVNDGGSYVQHDQQDLILNVQIERGANCVIKQAGVLGNTPIDMLPTEKTKSIDDSIVYNCGKNVLFELTTTDSSSTKTHLIGPTNDQKVVSVTLKTGECGSPSAQLFDSNWVESGTGDGTDVTVPVCWEVSNPDGAGGLGVDSQLQDIRPVIIKGL